MEEKVKSNPVAERYKQEYNSQSEETKKRLDRLREQDPREYQVKIIKRKRILPDKGDVFVVNPIDGVYYCGVVISSGIEIWETYSSVVFILDKEYDSMDIDVENLELEKLLCNPQLVDKGYWSRGYFYNIGKRIEIPDDLDYGFYSTGKKCYVDEYENKISHCPKLLGIYGIATGIGVARKINRALILKGRI